MDQQILLFGSDFNSLKALNLDPNLDPNPKRMDFKFNCLDFKAFIYNSVASSVIL
jgi:hypothetical protein